MTEQKDDRYINSFRMKEMVFEDDNSIIAVDVKVDDFIEKLKSLPVNESGYTKMRIVRRKIPSEYGHTHFLAVYTPRSKDQEDNATDTKSGKDKGGKGKTPKGNDQPF